MESPNVERAAPARSGNGSPKTNRLRGAISSVKPKPRRDQHKVHPGSLEFSQARHSYARAFLALPAKQQPAELNKLFKILRATPKPSKAAPDHRQIDLEDVIAEAGDAR